MDLTRKRVRDLGGVNAAHWDALQHGGSPFLEHGFLRALERSGSVSADAGWDPHYVLVHAGDRLVGAVAAFVKDHSYGEYIFDFHWARASHQAGIPYYPKVVVAAPATPATGPRLLLHPELDANARDAVIDELVAGVRELARRRSCTSIHWLFCTPDEREALAERGFFSRASYQFHFHNPGYADFDAFLAALTSRKRKQIRKERRRARAAVDEIAWIDGPDLTDADLRCLDRYYRRTVALYGGRAYLRPGFFEALVEEAPERVRFCVARIEGEIVAGALFLETEQALYGRYWGCDEEIPGLHFEIAYYGGIERCIELGLPRFEAGAQGEHKLLRGFLPRETCSAHELRHPGLARAVGEFCREESEHVRRQIAGLEEYGPFRQPTGDEDGGQGF